MNAPVVSQDDLVSFQATHFSGLSTNHFSEHFLGPIEEDYTEEFEDNGLGYYADGVKRTLTDEQIAIFRHSEIQALLRDRRHAEEAKFDDKGVHTPVLENGGLEVGGLNDMGSRELSEEATPAELQPLPPSNNPLSKKKQKNGKKAKKAEQARQRGFFKQNIKPDLRKRTWDKVDQGLGNLDYDEDSAAAPIQNPASQRRRISYDD